MKKFKLFLLAAVAVLPVLQSCNDSDVEGADSMALVTILNPGGLSGTFYFKADNGQTLYPSQFAVPTGGYNPEDGQRAFIYYSLLEEKSQQYDYNIKLYGISEILTKDVEEMNESNEDEFGDEPIELVKLSGEDKFDCLISAGYFTCSFQIKVTNCGETDPNYKPAEPENPGVKTGDEAHTALWLAAASVSLLAAAALLLSKKKHLS